MIESVLIFISGVVENVLGEIIAFAIISGATYFRHKNNRHKS